MWRAVLKAAAAEPMSDREKAAFGAVAAREPPAQPVKELVCVAGRGAGKDSIAGLIATCAAINFDPRGKLRPGEKATVMCLACDRHQAGILFRYIAGYFETIPALKAMVTAIGGDYIELCNDVAIEVHTNSFRAVRGRSILCAVLDEVAFFRDENFASPNTEVDAAISPGLARLPGSIKVLTSSVHKRSGLLYQRYRDYYGRDNDDVLVVYGTTLQFNPSFDESIIEKALAEDPERYGAEYLSKWRDDLSTWLSRELLDAFAALERRTFSTGRERVDPGPGHDDLCNSAAIALSLADNKRGPIEIPDEVLR
jgi:hypothetical protein